MFFFFYNYYFKKNYIKRARFDVPLLLANKKYRCLRCDCESISLYDTECPNCHDRYCDISINVGISALKAIDEYCSEKKIDFADPKDQQLYEKIRKALLDALPYFDGKSFDMSTYYDRLYKMFKVYNVINDHKKVKIFEQRGASEELIHFYCDEYNRKKYYQHISKIVVKNLFGYHSYELNIKSDLSIIFGANGLGKTTVLKILDYLFINPTIDDYKYNELKQKSHQYLESIDFVMNENISLRKSIGIYGNDPFSFSNVLDDKNEQRKISNQIEQNKIRIYNNLRIAEIKKIAGFLFKIPFRIIKVEFLSGEYIQIEKINKSPEEKELILSYFSREMFLPDIHIEQVRGEVNEESFKDIDEHYENINKLFPLLNSKDRYLFIKVNHSGNILDDFSYQMNKIIKETKDILTSEYSVSDYYYAGIDLDVMFSFINRYRNRIIGTINNWDNYLYTNGETRSLNNENRIKIDNQLCNIEHKHNEKDVESLFLNIIKSKGISAKLKSYFEKLIGIYDNYILFKELFESIYNKNDPAKKMIDILDNGIIFRANKTLDNDFGEVLYENDLSSGEKNIINILYNLIFKTSSGSIVLIDEPEISLHSIWQNQFAILVKRIMDKRPGIQVIATSHSPFITSGYDKYYVEPNFLDE